MKTNTTKDQNNYSVKNNENLIEIINLSKSFNKNVILKNVNLTIKKGDKIALIGVNGCGKTTLTEMILDLKMPTSGKILYNIPKKNFLLKTQVVYQTGDYPRKLKLKDIINLYRNFFKLDIKDSVIDNLLKRLQLDNLKLKKINKLSFGQRKKLEAILVLLVPGNFLIIDELTAGVDINGRVELLRMFDEMCKKDPKKSMIWITHDIEEINLCNRIIMISKKNKKITYDGTLADAVKKWKTVKNMVYEYIKKEIKS